MLKPKVIQHCGKVCGEKGENELTVTIKCVRCQRVYNATGYISEMGKEAITNGARRGLVKKVRG